MAQLIDNLLLNARLYTDAPGEVAVSLRADDDAVQLVVEDSAPGVTDHDLPRLFDRLFRADPARERGRGGSGLGLAICEAIARAHGGSIAASHAALGGLRVSVSLPRGAG